ncbi:splicing factor U2af large subunit A [Malania oleifera]|uniref:splicing factor U2af large subunit A n=1 Tax=Malania oleifera TaxID=397392 RepID=UPI0025AE630A|nr:splicing factor U2af large subunit A [Malania oleifera]
MSSRSSRQKEKHGNRSELSKDNSKEGTAARTRPFSFDEIMLRRKNKKLSGDVEEASNILNKDHLEDVSNHFESDRGSRHIKDSFAVVQKLTLEESVRLSSRKKEEKTLVKEDNLAKGNNKESRRSENALKEKLKEDVTNKAKGSRIEKGFHSRRKNDEWSTDESESEHEKKRSRDSKSKDRYTDRSRGKSERESKRKHRNGDSEKDRDKNFVKKHDLGKLHNPEFLERKERRESPPPRYEESRTKRRRSRSREHDKNRGRRSISLSPRAHKREYYHGREHGDLFSHSLKGRSGKQHSEIDRSKISSNGLNSHYRRHSGSASGLGGYSPRKRRTEAAVRTPSPTKRSPEKKSAGWDLPPPGTNSNFTGAVISNLQSSSQTDPSTVNELSSVVPVAPTTAKPLFGVSSNAFSLMKGTSIDSIQLTQATRPMRRLYIENVPASASEKALMECLNNFLLSSGTNHILGTQPCISCIIHKEKGHAFVEFLTPEDASAALSFDGRSLFGSILKIRRPKDFVEVTNGVSEKSVAAVDKISDIVMDSPHKIFIGGISEVLSSEMLVEIISTFGSLKAYRFQVNEYMNGPCAFLEYVDQSVTPKACAGLNGMKLGGQVLTVVQAFPNASSVENDGNQLFYGIPEHAKPLLEKPTEVLKLKNVFNSEGLSLLSEAEVEEILEDIRLECARFGTVKSVNVVKCNSNHANTADAYEVSDHLESAAGHQDVREDKNELMETLEGGIDHGSKASSRVESEPPNNAEELVGVDRVAEGDCIRNDEPANISSDLNDESSELGRIDSKMAAEDDSIHQNNSDATLGEPSNKLDTTEDQMECHTAKVHVFIKTQELSMESIECAGEELNLEEANGMQPEACSKLDDILTVESDAAEKDDNREQVCNLADIFEPGCVLVEYKRVEASCMAAHCLHGRFFDDRIVTVGYVALDLYCARFPK